MKVNLIIPAFFLTNDYKKQENIIKKFSQTFPGLIAEQVIWREGQKYQNQCFIRVVNLNTNLNSLLKQNEEIQVLQKNLQNIKQDIATIMRDGFKTKKNKQGFSSKNAMESCNSMLNRSKKAVKFEEGSQQKTMQKQELISIEQLMETISALTHQNIALKDTLALFQVQLEISKNRSRT